MTDFWFTDKPALIPENAYPVKHDIKTHQRPWQKSRNLSKALMFDLQEISVMHEMKTSVDNSTGMPRIRIEPLTGVNK